MNYARKILISSKKLKKSDFRHSVVLILCSNAEGNAGVALNFQNKQSVADTIKPALMKIKGVDKATKTEVIEKTSNMPIMAGGPCEAPVVCIHTNDTLQSKQLSNKIFFTIDPDEIMGILKDEQPCKLYCGQCGWGPGQLEAEIKNGYWHVSDFVPEYVFHNNYDSDEIWKNAIENYGTHLYDLLGFPTNLPHEWN